MKRIEYVVIMRLEDDEAPGDQCESIRHSLASKGYDVEDVGWITPTPTGIEIPHPYSKKSMEAIDEAIKHPEVNLYLHDILGVLESIERFLRDD